MIIEIEIPDKDIPQRQDSIDIHMSFIDGKPCECNYPFTTIVEEEKTKTNVLDKISAEIEEVNTYDGIYIDRAYALEIIDKYKAESEG